MILKLGFDYILLKKCLKIVSTGMKIYFVINDDDLMNFTDRHFGFCCPADIIFFIQSLWFNTNKCKIRYDLKSFC